MTRGVAGWLEAAQGVAAEPAADVVARDATGSAPIAYRLREAGQHALTGALPRPGPYT
ncbi:hypothetical protein J5X84_26005 [Streptosporangiaceae bacterium NEAU-GS5]|nr:hypothetical protein [Streptosporangiaceae bacterium NEAU-GS5]